MPGLLQLLRAALRRLIAIISSPFTAGSILAVLIYRPGPVWNFLEQYLHLHRATDLNGLKAVLKAFLAIRGLQKTNQALNTLAQNNWRVTSQSGWNWPSEIAVVTGGCSGIGLALVQRLVKQGVRVAILDIQPPPNSLLGNDLVAYYQCDITSSKSVAAAADGIRHDIGHPSILINNAGIASAGLATPRGILEISEASLHKIFNINCISHWITTQQFVPRMVQLNKGHIVTVASMAAFFTITGIADYAATKAAAMAFHEGLRSDLKSLYKAPNVITTIVHPNYVLTPMTAANSTQIEKANGTMLTSNEVADQIIGQILKKKGGRLIIPSHASLGTGIRTWPAWIQEFLRDQFSKTRISNFYDEKEIAILPHPK